MVWFLQNSIQHTQPNAVVEQWKTYQHDKPIDTVMEVTSLIAPVFSWSKATSAFISGAGYLHSLLNFYNKNLTATYELDPKKFKP